MVDPLAPLLADGLVDEIVARLKSGKEADLWLVRHGDEVLAAKVYKARDVRSFKNDAAYKEGRQVRDTRTQRAMQRGSRFGRAAAEDAWKAKEADALFALHAAGVRVPKPVAFYEGVLLMEVVVDPAGHPAPRLIDAHLERAQAAALYADLRAQVVRMLCSDLIHGDLSPYNVLLGWNGPVVIDFPQVVGAAHNSQAESFLRRDVENLRRFFAALDPALHGSAGDAREIWRAYARRELTPDFVPSGRAPEAAHGPRREATPEAAPARSARREFRPEPAHGPRREFKPDRRGGRGPPPQERGPAPGAHHGRPHEQPGARAPEHRHGGDHPEHARRAPPNPPPAAGASHRPGPGRRRRRRRRGGGPAGG